MWKLPKLQQTFKINSKQENSEITLLTENEKMQKLKN